MLTLLASSCKRMTTWWTDGKWGCAVVERSMIYIPPTNQSAWQRLATGTILSLKMLVAVTSDQRLSCGIPKFTTHPQTPIGCGDCKRTSTQRLPTATAWPESRWLKISAAPYSKKNGELVNYRKAWMKTKGCSLLRSSPSRRLSRKFERDASG